MLAVNLSPIVIDAFAVAFTIPKITTSTLAPAVAAASAIPITAPALALVAGATLPVETIASRSPAAMATSAINLIISLSYLVIIM